MIFKFYNLLLRRKTKVLQSVHKIKMVFLRLLRNIKNSSFSPLFSIRKLSKNISTIFLAVITKTNNKQRNHSNESNKIIKVSNAFSMMELLFVLVITGILASLALPKISFSRTNALSIAIQSDIQTIISGTQEYSITNEFPPQNANPQWLITYFNLSPQRWIANGDLLKIAKNGTYDNTNDCLSIRFDQTRSLQILFNRSNNSSLCQNLMKNYLNDITVPLNIAF